MSQSDALSQAILRQRPELAGQVHYVNGRAWCDGVNHTTACEPGDADKDIAEAVAAERERVIQLAQSLKFTLYRPAKNGPGGGHQALDVVPLGELLAALCQEGGTPCPGGCGCRLGTDDADRRECGCDEGCCESQEAGGTPGAHTYLSTSCLHGEHGYCQSKTGSNETTEWAKAPACCKFCAAPCVCHCHVTAGQAP